MNRYLMAFAGAALMLAPNVGVGQTTPGPRLQWQTGQVLSYRVMQKTTATDVAGEEKSIATSLLEVVKRWEVVDVDSNGVATLRLSLASLKTTTRTPDDTVMSFDSQNPSASNVDNRDELVQYVGQPLAVLRLDARGQLVDVKESRHGPASRFESELPLRLVLPEGPFAAGQSWSRSYGVTIEPPQGVGEKFPAVQHYTYKGMAGPLAVVSLTTEVKPPADAKPDQVIPLLPMQPEGDIWFDTTTGRVKAVRLKVVKEVKEHRGPESVYTFESVYSEDLLDK